MVSDRYIGLAGPEVYQHRRGVYLYGASVQRRCLTRVIPGLALPSGRSLPTRDLVPPRTGTGRGNVHLLRSAAPSDASCGGTAHRTPSVGGASWGGGRIAHVLQRL